MNSREYNKRLVFGVGINDSVTAVKIKNKIEIGGKFVWKDVWVCPAYRAWVNMLKRCYGTESSVCDSWIKFSNFREWWNKYNEHGFQLDKDIIFIGNKLYSPETCAYVPQFLNACLTHNKSKSNGLPLGVHYSKRDSKYVASCGNGKNIKTSYGHSDPMAAHLEWIRMKIENLNEYLTEYNNNYKTDQRVVNGLLKRIEILRYKLSSKTEVNIYEI